MHKKINLIITLIFFGIILFVSCKPFNEELKQDERLNFYRANLHEKVDSLPISFKDPSLIIFYNDLVRQIKADSLIFSDRKRDKLLSELYTALSVDYYNINKVDSALHYSSLAIKADSSNVLAFYNKAQIYQRCGQDSLAIIQYTACITNDCFQPDSYFNRASLYEKEGLYREALKDYKQAMKSSDLSDLAHLKSGHIYMMTKEYDKAVLCYAFVVDRDSTEIRNFIYLADAYRLNGDSLLADSIGKVVLKKR